MTLSTMQYFMIVIDEYKIPVTQMIADQYPNKSNTADASAEAGTAYPSEVHTGCY